MIITRVDRYILRQVIPPMIISFLAVSVLMISGILQQQVKELLDEFPLAPLRVSDFLWMSLYALPMMVGMIIPVTFLFGLMLTYERMSRFREIIAMTAGGISMFRIALPTVILSFMLSIVCFAVQDIAQPWAFRQLMKLARMDLPLRITLDLIPTGKMYEYGKLRVYIRQRNEKGELLDIVVLQPEEDGKVIAFYADKARWRKGEKENVLEMLNGFWIESQERDNQVIRGSFERLEKVIPPLQPLETIKLRTGMSLRELLKEHAHLSNEYERTKGLPLLSDLKKYRSEIADRLSFPFMCLALGLIASPIGVRMRGAGTTYAFSSGFLIVGLYFLLYKLAGGGGLMPLYMKCLLHQLPNLIIGGIGFILLIKADRL
ncbi:MAG TPA: LptF/LptG family permease [Candidatus Hydrogenedens sp.]|nr:LptF/LptG family permease [Candidatus Hydrogenedens sp.]HOK09601.1 LptF/LptG family permease [Candidatus Hydrogenedens sp.]HOL18837.1 LptF/LptG family permease [Candidatus Hydrogenedens sp.]HPP59305.1 LptF/LptG family permease [Candidatus Hydrogenedens sp.]